MSSSSAAPIAPQAQPDLRDWLRRIDPRYISHSEPLFSIQTTFEDFNINRIQDIRDLRQEDIEDLFHVLENIHRNDGSAMLKTLQANQLRRHIKGVRSFGSSSLKHQVPD